MNYVFYELDDLRTLLLLDYLIIVLVLDCVVGVVFNAFAEVAVVLCQGDFTHIVRELFGRRGLDEAREENLDLLERLLVKND